MKSFEEVKAEVKSKFLSARKQGYDVKISQFYEVEAKMAGYKNWNVYAAILKTADKDGNK